MTVTNVQEGALHGLKIIDLSRVLAGPLCSMIMADHGAEVIKVEPPQGDDTRRWGPPFAPEPEGRGDASYYIGVNRNKRALALDISTPEGRAVLFEMLEDADVLIENFKTGTMEAWGMAFEADLSPRFPRLVYCRVTGFGATGPLGGLPGYDAVLQAMTGLMSINGDPSTGAMRIGTPIVDLSTGLYAVIGVLMALQERQRSGKGQLVDMTLYDCGMSLLHPHAANFFLNGKRPPLLGNKHPNVVPCDKFSTGDGEVFLVVGNESQFRKLVEILGIPELAGDPRFSSNKSRLENRDLLTQLLSQCFSTRDSLEVSVALLQGGVPIGPVMGIDDALAAEHSQSRSMVIKRGNFKALGTPIKLSRTPGGLRHTPPRFAQDSEQILAEHGFDSAAIQKLRDLGVLPAEMR